MFKKALLMGALIIGTVSSIATVLAAQVSNEINPSCPGIKELTAKTMAQVYSIDPSVVSVAVMTAKKTVMADYIFTETTGRIAGAFCTMRWSSSDMRWSSSDETCWNNLLELDCSKNVPGSLDSIILESQNDSYSNTVR